MCYFDFYSWNLFLDHYLFVKLVACSFFLFVKLIHWFFTLWCWFCSWNLLRADFCSWNLLRDDVGSWNLLHLDFSGRETCKSIFLLVKLIFFMELLVCSLWLVKFVTCWFFFSWNFYTDFSPRESSFVRGTCCMLIFVRDTCYRLIFLFVKLVHWFFSNRFCTCKLLRADFLFVELVTCWFLFQTLVVSWFFSSWNLYIDFSPHDTDFWLNLLHADSSSWNFLHADFR